MHTSAFAFVFSMLFCQGAKATPLHILVDPGHGGTDRGTVQNQIAEADITLKVSKYLQELLKKDSRFKASLTRHQDGAVSLVDRTRVADDVKADLLLSIHVNSSPEKRARGAEFYFQNQLPADEESLYMAHQESAENTNGDLHVTYSTVEKTNLSPEVKAILNDLLDGDRILRSSQLSKSLKINWQGHKKSKANSIRQAPFYVLSQTRIPAALIELGFLTNPDEYRDLTDSKAQNRMAQNIYSALIAYKESMDKESTKP